MEFLDEDSRPRFVFQSKAPSSESHQTQNQSKPFITLTISLSILLLGLSIFYFQSEPAKSLLLWLALSLLAGPFAPPSLTGGDIRVGRGPILEPIPETPHPNDETKKVSQKRSKPRRSDDLVVDSTPSVETVNGSLRKEEKKDQEEDRGSNGRVVAASTWVEEDTEMLKKQLLKHPVGKPRRWEAIAEALGGRFKVETVVKKAKELGEKKMGDEDSYSQFLKKRKQLDKRIEDGFVAEEEVEASGGNSMMAENNGSGSWSSGEDIALLNAMKAFPKYVPMRWEKIVASVPGKSKAACMKRISGLKKDFRSSKAASQS